MSLLTSTPSPAASPRSFAHVQRQPSSDTRPISSPRLSLAAATSPKRPFHAPPPRPIAVGSGARRPREESTGSVPSSSESRVRYVHAGTQYSPDGLPPTAGRTVARPQVEQPPGSTGSGGGKKRKERERMSEGEGMTDPEHSNSADDAEPAPAEPELRTEPSSDGTTASSSVAPNQPEPREARSTHGHSSAPKRSRPAPGGAKEMPQLYENCDPKDLGVLTSSMLMELIRLNDQIPLRDGRLTRFHSRAPPGISVSDYLQRLIHHATLSPPILLSMVWYIDRLCQLYPAFTINSLTVHRFLITAACVAAKGLSDSFWTNPTYARIGGIPVSELATLELEFLQKVQWKIVPKPETLEEYYRSLVDRTEGYVLESTHGSESDSTSLDGSDVKDDEDSDMVDEPMTPT